MSEGMLVVIGVAVGILVSVPVSVGLLIALTRPPREGEYGETVKVGYIVLEEKPTVNRLGEGETKTPTS